jgi:hypothetical protein
MINFAVKNINTFLRVSFNLRLSVFIRFVIYHAYEQPIPGGVHNEHPAYLILIVKIQD